uniref:Protein Skeletor, isoforms B/C n=2 Tax=Sipha flava TaxID=143950 RepID=A0A2S2PWW0_9HEMI
MGPTGGKHGYSAITGHVGWGISWYINGLLIPEINVVRGQTYTFVVEGGLDPEIPAKYHPFYITDDPVGGYGYKTAEERENIRVFAGVSVSKSGEVIPTGIGRLCNWTPDPQQPSADEFVSFGAYQRTLSLACDNGDPGIVQWTPDADTPDTVYYQCFTHRHLGWKINVLDACDKEQPGTPETYAPEDLQSRGSIQYTTRVKPDVENDRLYGSNNNKNMLIDPRAVTKHHDGNIVLTVPGALEQHLRNDLYRSPPPVHRDQQQSFAHDNGYRFPSSSAASQQNFTTMYAYPSTNYTYGGNVPFYMPKTHYGSPQPVRSSAYGSNHVAPQQQSFANYRPIRQPATQHYHPLQSNGAPGGQMMFDPKQPVAVKHGYRVSGKRLPHNGAAHHSVVYKKPIYKFTGHQSTAPVAMAYYNPVPPVPHPIMSSAYPGQFQHQQQFVHVQPQQFVHVHPQQQQQQFVHAQPQHQHQQQPSTSVSQSVSVSYSSSKHQNHQGGGGGSGYSQPIQSRQEHQLQGGFDPNTVVIESGFKPILLNGEDSVFQDRSDGDADGLITEPTVKYNERKMSKKLISRKLAAAKYVGAAKEDNERTDRPAVPGSTAAANYDYVTANVDHEKRPTAENATEIAKHNPAEPVVL